MKCSGSSNELVRRASEIKTPIERLPSLHKRSDNNVTYLRDTLRARLEARESRTVQGTSASKIEESLNSESPVVSQQPYSFAMKIKKERASEDAQMMMHIEKGWVMSHGGRKRDDQKEGRKRWARNVPSERSAEVGDQLNSLMLISDILQSIPRIRYE